MKSPAHELSNDMNAITLLLAIIERPYHPTCIAASVELDKFKEIVNRSRAGNATDAEVQSAIEEAKRWTVRLQQEFAEAALP